MPAAAQPVGAEGATINGETLRRRFRLGEAGFRLGVRACALSLLVLLVAIAGLVLFRAWPAIQEFGWGFLWQQQWNPTTDQYGGLALIYGTLVSSLLALLLAVPLGVAIGIFLSENLLPHGVRATLGMIVELLAAIPSVIYGLWGLATVIPITTVIGRWLFKEARGIPLFSTPPVGPGMLPAALVLGIMILPTIAALSRASLLSVPRLWTEGAYAMGASRWDVLLSVTLPSARSGIFGSVVLAFGRALGETMALAMLIGNSNRISFSLLAPSNTIASLLANSFGEASGLQLSALMYLALILLALSLLINFAAQKLLRGGDAFRA